MQSSRKVQITPPQQIYNTSSNTDETASEELLKLLADKKKELEEVTQVNRASEEIALYFKNLANNVGELSKGTKGKKNASETRDDIKWMILLDMADIIKSWDDTFMIMGLTTKENKRKNELFRYVKE